MATVEISNQGVAGTAGTAGADPAAAAHSLLQVQRAAFMAEGTVAVKVRVDRLQRAIELLLSNQAALCASLAQDFGQRPAAVTRLMDLFPAVHALKFARKHVGAWMRRRPRGLGPPLGLSGARAEILYQPLGVVGVISPWNFPVNLTFGPLAGVFAAGNRCLIKPSELTPHAAELMKTLVRQYFDPSELAVVTGGADVAAAFSRLPFDHLVFTGSTEVGRRVMGAAADSLVPLTLELGGKCPVVIGRSADLARAVDRILIGKLANAGQMCLAPDYVCLPRQAADEFVRLAQQWLARAYPGLPANADYTSMVDSRHFSRARELIEDARGKGARIIELAGEAGRQPGGALLMSPVVVLDVRDDMRVMREEIFAPILPVCLYEGLGEAIALINGHARALACYYFGTDRNEECELLARTRSGGVTVNDVVMHYLAEELPFGGIGASGMGAYHGEHGFVRFSHARSIVRMSRLDTPGLLGLRPPYGRRLGLTLKWLLRR